MLSLVLSFQRSNKVQIGRHKERAPDSEGMPWVSAEVPSGRLAR